MKEKAAEELKLTSADVNRYGLIDEVVPEPAGGAHWDYNEAAQILKQRIIKAFNELKQIPADTAINNRIEKFQKMGFWEEI
jgi:acetyl-CoA carboxylase carboxyl transferase subunit alpha